MLSFSFISHFIYDLILNIDGGGEWKWDQIKNAPLCLKAYYRENELRVFHYSSMLKKKDKKKKNVNEFRNLWVTKTFVVAEHSIPSISRRVAVVNSKIITFTPLETAINNIIERNHYLQKVIFVKECYVRYQIHHQCN